MAKKPLMKYNPTATRSLLPKPTLIMPYKNSSQVVIGDRTNQDRGTFRTTNGLYQNWPDFTDQCTNRGIVAEKFRYIHRLQTKK